MLAAVIFDCDGVLFDSWRANVAFYNAVLATAGQPALDENWARRAHVMASTQLFEAMFDMDAAMLAQVRDTARETDYGPFLSLMEPVPGLHDTLATLKRSYRLAMASNRGRTVHQVLRHFALDGYLEHAVGARDVPRPKPHPDMLEECVARLGVRADQTVYVGDAPSDMEAARSAGLHFVAIGAHEWAAQHIPELRALPAYLETIGGNGRSG
jgi:HAD superfamily hydrolase (TIGR01549 family)